MSLQRPMNGGRHSGRVNGWRMPLVNVALPGSGLLIAGHVGVGLGLLACAIVLLSLAIGAFGLFTMAVSVTIIGWLASLYAGLAAIAGGCWWRQARRQHYDPAQVRQLHRAACTAYLTDQPAVALVKAHALTRAAPEEAGTWRFLALVAADSGNHALAIRAEAQATAIENRN